MFNRLKLFLAPPVYEDEETNRKAQLLNTILIAAIVLITFLWLARLFSGVDTLSSATIVILGALDLCMATLFFVMRRGHIKLSASFLVAVAWTSVSMLAWQADGVQDSAIQAYFVVILIASLLSGWRLALFVTGLTIVAGWGFVYAESIGLIVPTATDPPFDWMIDSTFIFALTGAMVYLLIDGLQKALGEARASNQSLRLLSHQLERRVQERTRDLALAVEVSRRISHTQDLDKLLADSVELIRERFQLYHVQIYLADAAGQTLALRASTGNVGQQLLNRGHKLPIRWGSINGTAAFDKKTVLVTDTETNSAFHKNILLPFTRSEMAVPLLMGEQLLGVLDLQSDQPDALSEENLSIYESLASQLAVAIDNARLLRQTEQAQAEVKRYVQTVIQGGWSDFLDGIGRKETIGFRYNLDSLEEFDGPMVAVPENKVLHVPITVADTVIGTIQMEAEDDAVWTEEMEALVTAVASQVGQQAENLRLLTETDRYRQEAEQAIRHMRREAWQDYLANQLKTSGFVYDQRQVIPIDEAEYELSDSANHEMLHQPLTIQGEPFGEILLDAAADPETQTLVAMVAEQLSSHLENLRLSNQTEKALADTAEQAHRLAALNEISRDLSAVTDAAETFAVLARHMPSIIPHDFLSFALAKPDGASAKVVTMINDQPVTIFEDQPLDGTVVEVAIQQRQLVYLADIREHDYEDTNAMAERAGARSVMIAPLVTARGVLGGIDLMSNQVDAFDAQDKTLLQQIASLMASTLESQQLFAEAQKQAQKERMVNVITQKIQGTVTMESALETAVTELGSALGAKYTKIGLSLIKNENNNDGTA